MSKDAQTVKFKAGDIVLQEKTACDSIYIVKSGQLEAYKVGPDGERIPLGIINSGEYLGEMSYFLDSNHTNNVAALTDVELAKISRVYCDQYLKTLPNWFLAMIKGQAFRLSRANEILRRNDIKDDTLSATAQAIAKNS